MTDLMKLKELASSADEGYSGAHPRDSNNWKANEAFCRAASPDVVLALLEVAEKTQAYLRDSLAVSEKGMDARGVLIASLDSLKKSHD